MRRTPPSVFLANGERVENEEASPSPREEEDACCWTCWDCERVADLGGDLGEALEVSADTLTDEGLVYVSGLEPDRARR